MTDLQDLCDMVKAKLLETQFGRCITPSAHTASIRRNALWTAASLDVVQSLQGESPDDESG